MTSMMMLVFSMWDKYNSHMHINAFSVVSNYIGLNHHNVLNNTITCYNLIIQDESVQPTI